MDSGLLAVTSSRLGRRRRRRTAETRGSGRRWTSGCDIASRRLAPDGRRLSFASLLSFLFFSNERSASGRLPRFLRCTSPEAEGVFVAKANSCPPSLHSWPRPRCRASSPLVVFGSNPFGVVAPISALSRPSVPSPPRREERRRSETRDDSRRGVRSLLSLLCQVLDVPGGVFLCAL